MCRPRSPPTARRLPKARSSSPDRSDHGSNAAAATPGIERTSGQDPAHHRPLPDQHLADGFTRILTGCAAILRPGGHLAVTARPYRHHGELIDIPSLVVAAGTNAGLRLLEECTALIAGVRNGRFVNRGSFFAKRNVRIADAIGDPQWLTQHEDLILFQRTPVTPADG